jgi:hypothetical protein
MRFVCVVIAVLLSAGTAFAQGAAKRSGMGPCRQGALALIGMLDDKRDNTADYRHAYAAVVQTCGPAGAARTPVAARERSTCRDLALKMLDTIEGGKMRTRAFVRARAIFAKSCAPR